MDLRAEGKIRHIGVSNFGVRQLQEVLADGAVIAVNELPYSLLTRAIERAILPFCRERGIGVMAYMVLMQGLLSEKFQSLDDLPPSRTRTRHFSSRRAGTRHGEPGLEKETREALEGIRAVARELGLSVHRLALAWAMASPDITCTLAGTRNSAQLADNLAAAETALSAETMARLDEATQRMKAAWGPHVDLWENAANTRTW